MEESSFFNYWFTFFFALGFCFWFPMYVVKTLGKGLPDWGLACCIVLLFLFLPLLSLSFIRDVFPALWLGVENGGLDAVNTDMLSESLSQMSTLEQTFIGLSVLGIIGSMILNGFSAWMLYIRRVRRGLLTAFRLMWISALVIVVSVGVLPLILLGAQGFDLVRQSALALAGYFVLLLGITAYLKTNKNIASYYPLERDDK